MNSWAPSQLYGPSDSDVRHQINTNFVWDLPVGRGKKYLSGANRITNAIVGGWQTTAKDRARYYAS